MRIAIVVGLLALAACAQQEGPATKALAAYNACLDARGVEGCTVEKAKLDATLAYVDAASRATAANAASYPRPPLVLAAPVQPIYQQPHDVTCIGTGTIMNCF